MGHYTQLSLKERRQISIFLDMNYTVGNIARRLGRHRSTIYREIKRNETDAYYLPAKAHKKAQLRCQRAPTKLTVNSPCYKYVLEKLKLGWSPEQIVGRMRQLSLYFKLCHETIYQYIYRHAIKKLHHYLTCQRKQRKQRRYRYKGTKYGDLRAIGNRPESIENRWTLGHWEGDTIRFSRERKQSVTTLVERKSRFVILQKNLRSTSACVIQNIANAIHVLPKKLWRTVTFDQGSEFAYFSQLELNTGCQVFYADPHSPWQRGTNENTNKRLRRYMPKKMNVYGIGQEMLNELANRLNKTPRKCLAYLTPEEVFFKLRRNRCRT